MRALRADLAEVWEGEILPLLKAAPAGDKLRTVLSHDAIDLYVVRWVEKRHMRPLVSEQANEVVRAAGVTRQQPMSAELPEVARNRQASRHYRVLSKHS